MDNKEVNRYAHAYRILKVYDELNEGKTISSQMYKESYGLTYKTYDRDVEFFKNYYCEKNNYENPDEILIDEGNKRYHLEKGYRGFFSEEEALAISKILLESRAFCKEEKDELLSKIMELVADEDKALVNKVIARENLYYVPLKHGKHLMPAIRSLSEYIKDHRLIEIDYSNQEGDRKMHRVKPVAIMFSEFYFYLIAYMDKDSMEYPTVFRVDRIAEITDTGEKFDRIYDDSFKEGEFRKRVQFMYTGKLEHLRFEYHGKSIEAIQDRLPTAEVTPLKDGGYFVRAEVYGGEGAKMWLRSQGEWVEEK